MAAPVYPPQFANFWRYLSLPTAGNINTIPDASASPLSSFADGVPLIQMTAVGAGGIEANGADFNGILQLLSKHPLWAEAGGRYTFKSGLSTAWNGYSKGSVLISNDGANEYQSMVDNNITDFNAHPESIGVLWAPFGGAASSNGKYQLDTGTANAYVIASLPAITSYDNGLRVSFKALHSNTGASTLNAGGGTAALVQNNGTALFPGFIQAGQVYSWIYDSVTSSFVLDNSGVSPQEAAWTPVISGLQMDLGLLSAVEFTGAYIKLGNLWVWGARVGTSHGEPPSFHNSAPLATMTGIPGAHQPLGHLRISRPCNGT
jgi:hypothetical protein